MKRRVFDEREGGALGLGEVVVIALVVFAVCAGLVGYFGGAELALTGWP